MPAKNPSIGLRAVFAMFAVALCLTSARAADHEIVLHDFSIGNDGNGGTSLIIDAAGNLYGTTSSGGIYRCGDGACGTVFELSPGPNALWTETVLHDFGNGNDGVGPSGTLFMDAAGNLYGTTVYGGLYGYGIAYELSPSQGGTWTETVLYNFTGGGLGVGGGALVMDVAGNLYGTFAEGGIYSGGFAYELSPSQGGGWTQTVLHNFGNGSDGSFPDAGLILDTAGNLYGTTYQGGTDCGGCGTVYELSPSEVGWTETVLLNFNGNDGAQSRASLIMDAAGNLYGTTGGGGIYCACGTAFELSPSEGGGWTETVLHSFGNGSDGWGPLASLIMDAAGNLYSTTYAGGTDDLGTVFELSPSQGLGWTENVLYNFGHGNGGYLLFGSVAMDRAGNLYGTTAYGGVVDGTAFELRHPPSPRLLLQSTRE